MRHRSHIPPKLRDAHTKLHQTIDRGRFIKGSMVTLRNTCGKENCRCAGGERHESLYLSQSLKGKQRMMTVPGAKRREVEQMVKRYRRIRELIDRVSSLEWELMEKEKGR